MTVESRGAGFGLCVMKGELAEPAGIAQAAMMLWRRLSVAALYLQKRGLYPAGL